MKKLLPYALVLCCGLPLFACSCPDTTIYISKDTPLLRYPSIRLEWQLLINGIPAQKGVLPLLTLSSKHPTGVRLPAHIPPGNDELSIRLIYRRPSPGGTSRSAPLLTRIIPIRPWKGDYSIPSAGDLFFSDSNDIFTITSPNVLFQFDKQTGWLLHYEANHLVLMSDSAGLRPSLWPPAITEPHLQLFSTSTGSQLVIVRAEYTLPEVSCLLHMSYTINAAGEMLVGQSLEADSTRQTPPLPGFGMHWIIPAGLDSSTWYGPPADSASSPGSPSSPYSTSPPDIFHAALAMTPATPIRWITITGADNKGMRIIADSNCLLLHPAGKQLSLQHPISSSPLPYGSYHYSFKVSPLLQKK